MPNLADIYPEVNNQTSLFDNESYPTLDLLTVEVGQDQQITSPNVLNVTVSDTASRRKRLAQTMSHTIEHTIDQTINHKDNCQMQKTLVSVKDLNLQDIIIYPTSFETVVCSGYCHKHRVYIHFIISN